MYTRYTKLTVKDSHFIVNHSLLPIAVFNRWVILLHKMRLDELNGEGRLAYSTTSHHHYLVLPGAIATVCHLRGRRGEIGERGRERERGRRGVGREEEERGRGWEWINITIRQSCRHYYNNVSSPQHA